MKYLYLIQDPLKQKQLILLIIDDYTSNYYNSSYYIRQDYKNAICNFCCLNQELLDLLNTNLIYNKKNIFYSTIKLYAQGKKNIRKIFDIQIEKMKNFYENNYVKKYPEKNIITFFESQENSNYSYIKQFWFKQPKDLDQPSREDVLYNYLKDKFNINNDDECCELLSAVQDFCSMNYH